MTTTPDLDPRTRRACGCPEHEAAGRFALTRRQLLGAAALGAGAAVAGPLVSTQLAFAAPDYTGDTLVVLSLRGGMDGVSVVVPHGDPDYAALRPNIALAAGQLLSGTVDTMFGLHPGLAALLPFWNAGTFGAVHACGLWGANRSHFSAQAEMERAAPGSGLRSGWLDRVLGVRGLSGSSFQATQVGGGLPPESLLGPNPELALYRIDNFTIPGTWNATESARWKTGLRALHQDAAPSLRQPALTTLAAVDTAATVVATYGDAETYVPDNGAAYPDSDLGSSLRDVARLIKGGVGLQMATIDFGDWDMHVDLGQPQPEGWMYDHLVDFSQSLAAFATDLGTATMQNVTVITLTEFGRRIEENGSGGVDHGYGTAVLMLGGGVNGGQVHLAGDAWPGLDDAALVDGDLQVTADYRTVLAEVLSKRCEASSESLASVFPASSSVISPSAFLGVVAPRT